MNVRPRIAYLFPYAPGERDADVYGTRALDLAGFDVTVIDVSSLVGTSGGAASPPAGINVVRPRSKAELAGHFAATGFALALDFVAGLDEPSVGAEDVLRVAQRCGVPFVVVSAAALPPLESATSMAQTAERLFLLLGRALDLPKVVAVLRREARRLLPGSAPLLPAIVFSGHSPALEAFVERTGMPSDRVVWINSLDYDTYARWLRDLGGVTPAPERTAVFIDEAASSHPDFDILGTQSQRTSDDVYSSSMRAFFDRVEERTGLRVVISVHPRADYCSRAGFFGNRELVTGRTVDLVARSSVVLGHCSTALGLAALLDKPTLLVSTGEMERSGYALQVERLAAALGLVRVNVDNPSALAAVDWDVADWRRDRFPEYVRRYMRSPEAPAGLSTWEIIAAEFNRLTRRHASA